MDTLQSTESIPPPPTCGFTVAPLGRASSYEINGVIYTSSSSYETFTNTDLIFTSWVIVPSGIAILEYHWDFGDGTDAFGEIVHHTYTMATPETHASFCVTDNYRRQVCAGQLINLQPGIPIAVGEYVVHG